MAIGEKRAEAHSFGSVAREWHEVNKGRWTKVHQYDVLGSLERDVLTTLGKRHINDIEAHDVLDMLHKIEKRGSIETARRIRQRISGVFLLAISKRIARDNPDKDLTPLVNWPVFEACYARAWIMQYEPGRGMNLAI